MISGREETLAQFMRRLRIAAGLSQSDISSKLGYSSAQFVSNWERGLVPPPAKKLKKLALILKTRPKILIERFVLDYRAKLLREIQ